MALSKPKAFTTLRKTKTGNFFERLEKREHKKQNEIREGTGLKKKEYNPNRKLIDKREVYRRYYNYRTNAKEIIKQTASMLERFRRDPKLRNAEFVFLDRDALPYMYIARELCREYGFRKEQFKKILSTKEAEKQINNALMSTINAVEYMTLESNSKAIVDVAKKIPKTTAIRQLKKWIKGNIDLKKPVVVIDSGFNGTAVKRTQFILKDIDPRIETYSAMFLATKYAKPKLDYYFGEVDFEKFGINDIEGIPKFQGKLLKLKNGKQIREKIWKSEVTDGTYNPVNAEIALIAIRNALFRYKKEKDIS